MAMGGGDMSGGLAPMTTMQTPSVPLPQARPGDMGGVTPAQPQDQPFLTDERKNALRQQLMALAKPQGMPGAGGGAAPAPSFGGGGAGAQSGGLGNMIAMYLKSMQGGGV